MLPLWRTELTQCLMVHWALWIFTSTALAYSLRSCLTSFHMPDTPFNPHATAHTVHSGGVVPHAVPPLPQLESCQKRPRLSSNPQNQLIPNPLRPLVSA